MFSLPYTQYVHGSALRTWNCVARFANVLWFKVNHLREPIMPRSRRRHHSRSRSRSRSHSHDRDREAKRRKVESYESPQQKRSVSSQPEDSTDTTSTTDRKIDSSSTASLYNTVSENTPKLTDDTARNSAETANTDEGIGTEDTCKENENEKSEENANEKEEEAKPDDSDKEQEKELITPNKIKTKVDSVKVTPSRRLTPKQQEKQLESEKKKQERQKEKEDREKKRQEEKEQKRQKLEQKQKEKEEKLKEIEEKKKEKEQKRKEREEKEEQKRKEKEEEKIKKQQELDEKTREKQKIEEQKQKAAAAFTKFFVAKKIESDKKEVTEKKNQNFMPFEKKSDMKLAPITRATISEERKSDLDQSFNDQSSTALYLTELKSGKRTGKSGKTWPLQEDDDDVVMIGESIEEEKPKLDTMRTKFLSFVENQRPPYYGTFRKKSISILPTKPFQKDENLFNYEVDSEEEWEDEGEGESLKGTDDEDDEEGNESDEGKDYEVDNKFFVPHGHLSDDEVDDEVECKLSPESHKAKLKLLKNEFDEERKSKQHKLKPSVIGCIWYTKVRAKAEETFDKYLQPFGLISTGRIEIKPRSELMLTTQTGRPAKQLTSEHIPMFLKYLHASTKKAKDIVKGFLEHLNTIGVEADVSKLALGKQLRQFAEFTKTKENGAKRKYWLVKDDVQKKFHMDLPQPSKNDPENTRAEVSPEK